MKKTTLLLLSVCAILVAAPRVGDRRVTGGEAATGIAFLLPAMDVDLSDLDVRDLKNNPVSNPAATQELTDLFRENLLNLMVFAPPHAMTATLTWIESISHRINKLILNRLQAIFGPVQDLFFPPSRRFVHNVHNLWVTFSVGLFAGCLLLSALRLPKVLCAFICVSNS